MSAWRGGAWRVGGVLRVVLRWRGGLAGSWRAVLGRRAGWWGIACRVGAAWWWVGSGGLACRVGAARWVGGGGMEVARLHEKPAMSSVLRAVLGRRSGLAVVGCRGRMEVARVREWPATSVQGFACRVGAARRVGSGGVLGQGRMKAAHVHEWPATSRVLRAVLGRRGGLAVAGRSLGVRENMIHRVERRLNLWRGNVCRRLVSGKAFFSYHHAVIPRGPSPRLRKIEDVAEDELVFGPMHKICHCRPLVHASHLSHLHSSPPQHAAPTWLAIPRLRKMENMAEDELGFGPNALDMLLPPPQASRRPDMTRDTPPTAAPTRLAIPRLRKMENMAEDKLGFGPNA
ncbi:hypothetical protein EDB86DRAFT_2828969 [Lactarius hatsudake]|nr:hypothetical protein EDB86DRAFT_2828969 [Lactarius hatsudake]